MTVTAYLGGFSEFGCAFWNAFLAFLLIGFVCFSALLLIYLIREFYITSFSFLFSSFQYALPSDRTYRLVTLALYHLVILASHNFTPDYIWTTHTHTPSHTNSHNTTTEECVESLYFSERNQFLVVSLSIVNSNSLLNMEMFMFSFPRNEGWLFSLVLLSL